MSNNKGIFLNIDINTVTFPFFNKLLKQDKITDDDINLFVDQYADTQITDIAYNIFCQFSATPTSVLTDAVTQYEKNEVNGTPVDYTKNLADIYGIYKRYGDPYEAWIKRTWEKGMTPWLSIRPNDCHAPDDIYCWIHGDIFHEALKNGWNIGWGGYFIYCLDYAVPEIRKYMLDYTREQLLRYDVGGLELDFSREWYCFKQDGLDHAAIMNDYMRETKKIVKEAEARWGHKIKISVRLMRDIEQNLTYGFDPKTYASEKLVDSITVTPRWSSNDSDMPISEWKMAFPDIEIYAGITDLTLVKLTTVDVAAAYSAQYLAQGADKIYLFDYFNDPLAKNPNFVKLHNICGSLDTLSDVKKQYVVTYQDMVGIGCEPWKPLPAKADGFELDISIAPASLAEDFCLHIGLDRESDADIRIFVNGKELPADLEVGFEKPYYCVARDCRRYILPTEFLSIENVQKVNIASSLADLNIEYLDITANRK